MTQINSSNGFHVEMFLFGPVLNKWEAIPEYYSIELKDLGNGGEDPEDKAGEKRKRRSVEGIINLSKSLDFFF